MTFQTHNRSANPVVLFIWIMGGVVAIGIVKAGIDYALGENYIATLMRTVLQLDLIYFDSWWPMTEAAVAKLTFPDQGIYQNVFFERHIKFQYPPISILPFLAVYSFDISWEVATRLANFISFLSLFGIVLCGYQTIIVVIKNYFYDVKISNKLRLSAILIALIGTFSFYPIMWGQFIGQVQVFLDLLISMAFIGWLMGRKYFSGMMIALAALVKPQFALLLFWAIFRKEKRFLVGLVLVFLPAGIVSLAIFGFQEHMDYLKALSVMGKHGEVYWPNQSINGLLNRLLSEATSLNWTLEAFAPYNAIVYFGTLVSTVAFIFIGLFYRSEANPDIHGRLTVGSALDLATMLLVCTMASPVAWIHHYGILMPIYLTAFLLAAYVLTAMPSLISAVNLFLLCVSYFLLSNYFVFAETKAFSLPPLNLLQSIHLYGAFILLASLFLLRRDWEKLSSTSQINVKHRETA